MAPGSDSAGESDPADASATDWRWGKDSARDSVLAMVLASGSVSRVLVLPWLDQTCCEMPLPSSLMRAQTIRSHQPPLT
jgi:hypothetical protein